MSPNINSSFPSSLQITILGYSLSVSQYPNSPFEKGIGLVDLSKQSISPSEFTGSPLGLKLFTSSVVLGAAKDSSLLFVTVVCTFPADS
jgi:hypothetical protein